MNKLNELLQETIDDVDRIENILGGFKDSTEIKRIAERYPIKVTPYYLSLIDRSTLDDPVRKMCIPTAFEYSDGGEEDTSGESSNTVIRGMQHKYHETVLILSTNQCAMYCRHCFRKRLVGLSSDEIATFIPEMVEYIKKHKEVNNVLITGGDSFMLSNEVIKKYLESFSKLENIQFIRFGTRIPVVLPKRIYEDEELLELLKEYGKIKQIAVVTQFNHPHEITEESAKAIKALNKAGCFVRNQTVMLKGVNDNPKVLAELMNRLVSKGVIPYYVFQCRPVKGVLNQFQVPIRKSLKIIDRAKSMMNGQAKSFHYVMSHPTGKIEIIGEDENGSVIFKYHQAKNDADQNRIFKRDLGENQSWLE
ncbi:MAG: KamA family radical SAM protein [Lachnospiraceae bacterium]|nr:KamA family radical SAM protein [Lachnospiraceae bacterium]